MRLNKLFVSDKLPACEEGDGVNNQSIHHQTPKGSKQHSSWTPPASNT